jgi:hypothetical protein
MQLQISHRLLPQGDSTGAFITLFITTMMNSAFSFVELSEEYLETLAITSPEEFGPTIHRLQTEAGVAHGYTAHETHQAVAKLYQTPFAQKEETGLAKRLDDQVSAYRDVGCKEHYYVSNLSKSAAESVVSKLGGSLPVIPIAGGVTEGTDELLSLLDDIVRRLDELRDKNFERELEGRVRQKRTRTNDA